MLDFLFLTERLRRWPHAEVARRTRNSAAAPSIGGGTLWLGRTDGLQARASPALDNPPPPRPRNRSMIIAGP